MSEVTALPGRRRGLVRRFPWRGLRRVAQLAFLLLFFWLFRKTESSGADTLEHPVNFFFRLDPLVGASAMLGAQTLLIIFWPALIVIALTALLGRFFCGWFCPLGTILDLAHRLMRPLTRRSVRWSGHWSARLRPVRYIALAITLLFAALSLPVVGYLDPFALLVRASAFWGDSALYRGTNAALSAAESSSNWSALADRVYPVLRDHLLPFSDRAFQLAGVALAMIAVIITLELIKRRFWCRYICPLGAMVGLVARVSTLRRVPEISCVNCSASETCGATCRMDAFPGAGRFKGDDCNLCMDCVADCPDARTTFRFKRRSTLVPPPVDLSRRAALITLAVSVATPAVVKAARVGRSPTLNPALIRPPGVGDEDAFLDLCVRCGLCLKVCPTNALQPTALIAGIEGIFSPRLMPRIGYCEIGCTLCGQVCPTGAIPRLDAQTKAKTVMGKAVLDLELCLPWAKNEECICCEEHCPVADKAIEFDEVQEQDAAGQIIMLKRPFVHWDRCTGCGICENKCPVEGEPAIFVRRTESVPRGEGRGGGMGRGRRHGAGRGRGGRPNGGSE